MFKSKHIKIQNNQKLKAKFFGLFLILELIDNQAYKLELVKQWSINNIFYIFLLKHKITKKKWIDKKTLEWREILKTIIIRSTMWKVFITLRFLPESQKWAIY